VADRRLVLFELICQVADTNRFRLLGDEVEHTKTGFISGGSQHIGYRRGLSLCQPRFLSDPATRFGAAANRKTYGAHNLTIHYPSTLVDVLYATMTRRATLMTEE
jgi:hypothetical protein